MHRQRLTMILAVLGACLVGTMAWVLGVAAGPAAGQTKTHRVVATVITVTAGQPSELAFKLSKMSIPAAGTVTFKVTNKGSIAHDFEICSAVTTTGNAFTCKGTTTKMLKTGQTASITVKLKKGKYEFLCTVPGHAQAGMKGIFGAGVKLTSGSSTPVANAGGAAAAVATCANPQNTTITVQELEYRFVMSSKTFPCGSVTFNQTNTGQLEHNFSVQGVANGAGVGAFIQPGQSTTTTVKLTPGTYTVVCEVPEHIALGMTDSITVTG
jgi:uncharacterized cupredoxin-like copper-binding protein